jgi:hypothetical protein
MKPKMNVFCTLVAVLAVLMLNLAVISTHSFRFISGQV